MSRNSNILIALLGGVVIGAALGILLAPDKGAETRKKMTDAARRVADKVKEGMKSASSSAYEPDAENPVA